jgi:hypothetical protein
MSYTEAVQERLARGAEAYEERSYQRPIADLLAEIAEELADVGGWAAITHHALAQRPASVETQRRVLRLLARATKVAGALWEDLQAVRAEVEDV